MLRSFRLLPLTILIAFLLLGLKIGQVMHDGQVLLLSYQGAAAQTAAPAAPATPATPPAAVDPKVTPPSTDASDDDTDTAPKHEFSQVEVDLLQSLAKRREDLDEWAKQTQLKENMLIATEQRINDKITTLENMKKELEKLLALYNEQEDTKIRSLVKIYENMKPKDAARIFEELDMPVLLTVVDRMSERKVAPILAAMSPTKAKDLTIQLAEQRKLQKPRTTSAAAAVAAPPDASGTAPDTSAAAPANGTPPAQGR